MRIDLPVKAFVPPGWLAQESLRLELYRRIGMARDHEALDDDPRRDRGPLRRACPIAGRGPVRDRVAPPVGRGAGVREITTFKEQVRVEPLVLSEAVRVGLSERIAGATYHAAQPTLNLPPERVFGADLVRWVEARAARRPWESGTAA